MTEQDCKKLLEIVNTSVAEHGVKEVTRFLEDSGFTTIDVVSATFETNDGKTVNIQVVTKKESWLDHVLKRKPIPTTHRVIE
jgi:outer membrane protein assembly factor BamA